MDTIEGTLKIQISLGNDLVSNFEDLAGLVAQVQRKLMNGFTSHQIMDDNGNCVGNFWISSNPSNSNQV